MKYRFLANVPLIVVSLTGSAVAHAQLVSSIPAADARIATAPAEISIEFSESLEAKYSSIHVQDASGATVDKGDAHVAPMDARHLAVGLKNLQPGVYRVIWNATATDTHKTHGEFVFRVTG